MRISDLEKVDFYEIEKWLQTELKLTDYQVSHMKESEVIRDNTYFFYKRSKKKRTSFLWRLSLLLFPVYISILLTYLLFKFILTGNRYVGDKFYNKIHSKWLKKAGVL